MINNSEVPAQEDVDSASKNYWGLNKNREDSFLRNYNNLIFLQMEKKHKKHKSKNAVPGAILTKAKALTFVNGADLFFNMMNENTNGFAGLVSFMRFYRFSALYLEIDSLV